MDETIEQLDARLTRKCLALPTGALQACCDATDFSAERADYYTDLFANGEWVGRIDPEESERTIVAICSAREQRG